MVGNDLFYNNKDWAEPNFYKIRNAEAECETRFFKAGLACGMKNSWKNAECGKRNSFGKMPNKNAEFRNIIKRGMRNKSSFL